MLDSAETIIVEYQGTGLGAAAAAEFIAGVITSVTIGQWLLIAAAVGITALLAVALYRCLTGN